MKLSSPLVAAALSAAPLGSLWASDPTLLAAAIVRWIGQTPVAHGFAAALAACAIVARRRRADGHLPQPADLLSVAGEQDRGMS